MLEKRMGKYHQNLRGKKMGKKGNMGKKDGKKSKKSYFPNSVRFYNQGQKITIN